LGRRHYGAAQGLAGRLVVIVEEDRSLSRLPNFAKGHVQCSKYVEVTS
jgi:hypothetical protein